jgi:hypothetical protein
VFAELILRAFVASFDGEAAEVGRLEAGTVFGDGGFFVVLTFRRGATAARLSTVDWSEYVFANTCCMVVAVGERPPGGTYTKLLRRSLPGLPIVPVAGLDPVPCTEARCFTAVEADDLVPRLAPELAVLVSILTELRVDVGVLPAIVAFLTGTFCSPNLL